MNFLRKVFKFYSQYGLKLMLFKLFRKYPEKSIDYEKWREKHKLDQKEYDKLVNSVFSYRPKVSIIVPTYHTPEKFLREMIESVSRQTYSNWELCIADGSEDDKVANVVSSYVTDARIKFKKLEINGGISDNTNAAIEMSTGEYIALLDHDDFLESVALFEIVKAINVNKSEVIYTDEDKVSWEGSRFFDPHFKPDFNLELLRQNNYICHFFIVSRRILNIVKGFRKEFDGAQDYDFIFRCIESANSVEHVPIPLYHWRTHKDSTASNPESKAYAYISGKKAIEAHLYRCQEKAVVKSTMHYGFYHTQYKLVAFDKVVIVVIKNNSKSKQLQKCIKAIKNTCQYPNYSIIVVNRLDEMLQRKIDGEYIVLIDSSVKIVSEKWLESMLAVCQRNNVGAVGAKLFKNNETIYHAGIVLGMDKYAFFGFPRERYGYFHQEELRQEVCAVTKDFMMLPTSIFNLLDYIYLENEIALCKLIRGLGKKIIFEPKVCAYTCKSDINLLNWNCEKDDYYNINLSLQAPGYNLDEV
ncbi:glycosyltransferase, group 2 family protein [[Clostridium] scindens ATCC 35704]|uniref:Hyaluronan synthase n=1 Tax=Clostridium scindens (strain ATCC 35704 / DSM 5676 / VPI 13733 / 19) TaxID=411468 RepID=B0NG36_CLOS5|nr:glycosyltransferase [[Clostridium] scindens]EDS06490.1 glycosyltransferase, group 2 family protein [[Clostridium] scindens ATCC 35704]QBF76211.1 Hyaluronan synthase [[Clostridium] scindens ATCC 35704]QRO35978.1 glycosyltransferase [[Clostridium] scindens]WPB35363.1 hypothetical protein PBLEJBOC_00003 [[Clostridium] scindens]BDF17145.1 hypothetical protein CE91St59_24080 [[Clostridium] scindens]